MDIEDLTRMDADADGLMKSWSSGPSSENIDLKTCKEWMETLNRVYGTVALPLDLLGGYLDSAKNVVDHGVDAAVCWKCLIAVKKILHDHATGKEPPTPKEFKNYILHIEGTDIKITPGNLTLTLTHKDGSVDSR